VDWQNVQAELAHGLGWPGRLDYGNALPRQWHGPQAAHTARPIWTATTKKAAPCGVGLLQLRRG